MVLARKLGADLTKINIAYGCLGAGTDPARMTIDGYHAIKYAIKYKLPFDIVTNEELAGVPSYRAFSGMMIVAALAIKLGTGPFSSLYSVSAPSVFPWRTTISNCRLYIGL